MIPMTCLLVNKISSSVVGRGIEGYHYNYVLKGYPG